jgi:hypothetical protein
MNRHGLRHWRKQSRSDFILLPLQFGDTWREMTVQQHSPKTYVFPASKWDQLVLFASWARDWPWHCRGLYHELHDTGEAWGDLEEGHPKGCVHNPVVCCAGKMITYSACDRPSKHGFRSALNRHEMDFSWLVHPWEILFLGCKVTLVYTLNFSFKTYSAVSPFMRGISPDIASSAGKFAYSLTLSAQSKHCMFVSNAAIV